MDDDKQMVHPTTCQVSVERACPFLNSIQGNFSDVQQPIWHVGLEVLQDDNFNSNVAKKSERLDSLEANHKLN